jgi:hypothetical protein
MRTVDRIQMFRDVFAPRSGETVLFLIDTPNPDNPDTTSWAARRRMAQEWCEAFKQMGVENHFSVGMEEYTATGRHGAPIPERIVEKARRSNLVIAMTEYSASSSLKSVCDHRDTITRCASMPQVEKRMEETAFRADYAEIQHFAAVLERMLNDAVGAEITFSTHDTLYLDLRYRTAGSDRGDCRETGQFINFPSGEGAKVPYEATGEEAPQSGRSRTEGILPVDYDGELVRFVVKDNRITEVIGEGKEAARMRVFFEENRTRRNIAELGMGCNPKAVISGNVLEDEKVGLHIAYGTSAHLGGKVESDVHQDIVYARGCPIEGTTLTLIGADGRKTDLVRDAKLRYELLR